MDTIEQSSIEQTPYKEENKNYVGVMAFIAFIAGLFILSAGVYFYTAQADEPVIEPTKEQLMTENSKKFEEIDRDIKELRNKTVIIKKEIDVLLVEQELLNKKNNLLRQELGK